jgi:choline dehydrogenase
VAPVTVHHPVASAFFDAVIERGFPSTDDFNGAEPYGLGWYDMNIVDGSRQCTADAYLRPHQDRPNLTVAADALVTRMLVTGGRCRGVAYEQDGKSREALADREVILCAGTIGSPHLLMVSGAGPADHMRSHGITVEADLPGVGADLQDHVVANAVYAIDEPTPAGVNNHVELAALLRTDDARADPDVVLYPAHFPFSPVLARPPAHGFSMNAAVSVPRSRGTVRLSGPDVRQEPLIDPAYLTGEGDLDTLVAGLLLARTTAFGRWQPVEVTPSAADDDMARWRAIVREAAGSQHHAVGTCRIGAVVDPRLRVYGVDGLRIADASVMPTSTSMNPNATVIAIAERAAAFITEAD